MCIGVLCGVLGIIKTSFTPDDATEERIKAMEHSIDDMVEAAERRVRPHRERTDLHMRMLYGDQQDDAFHDTNSSSVDPDFREVKGRLSRREAVRHTISSAWLAFEHYELTRTVRRTVGGKTSRFNVASEIALFQLVDSLDTLHIAGLMQLYHRAEGHVMRNAGALVGAANTAEKATRIASGLLAAYALSQNAKLLSLAATVAEEHIAGVEDFAETKVSFSVAPFSGNESDADLLLLYNYLDHATKKTNFSLRADTQRPQTVTPQCTEGDSGLLCGSLLNLWLGAGQVHQKYLSEYELAADYIASHLHAVGDDMGVLAKDLNASFESHTMSHLACAVPGVLAQGALYVKPHSRAEAHLHAAKKLAKFCMYLHESASGLLPEELTYGKDGVEMTVPQGMLRGDAVRSFFIMHKVTSDHVYREWAWRAYVSMETHARACKDCEHEDNAFYSSVSDVRAYPPVQTGRMPPWFLGETLKYLFLTYEDALPFDCWVWGPHGHALPRHVVRGSRNHSISVKCFVPDVNIFAG